MSELESHSPVQPLCPDCHEDEPVERIMEDQQALEQTAALHYSVLRCGEKLERKRAQTNTFSAPSIAFRPFLPLFPSKLWQHVLVCLADALAYFYWRALTHLPAPQSTSAHVDPGFSLNSPRPPVLLSDYFYSISYGCEGKQCGKLGFSAAWMIYYIIIYIKNCVCVCACSPSMWIRSVYKKAKSLHHHAVLHQAFSRH